jgi:copper(I)-binding protein
MMRRVALAFVAALGLAACGESQPIAITHAWIRLPAPGLSVAAGYFDVVNRTATPMELVGASSEVAQSVEMHAESHGGETMQMRRLDSITLAPKQTVSFSPGGTHLMLLGMREVTSGAVPITLLFSDGSQQTVSFEVRTLTGEKPR